MIDDKLRIMFDEDAVDAKELQTQVTKALGGKLADADLDVKSKFRMPKSPKLRG